MNNYTKAAFERASKNFNSEDFNKSLAGKVAIVTGANSGIGLETTFALAQKGAKVYMLCRNEEKGQQAIKELSERDNKVRDLIFLKIVDVSIPSEIKNFVSTEFVDSKLDILVNNAGCMIDRMNKTKDNLDVNFATNLLAVYLLTELLIPKLAKCESRVVTVTSGGMLTKKLDYKSDFTYSTVTSYNPTDAYADQKVIIYYYYISSLIFLETTS
jgi:dehydrogenase/reductase SDR family protein 12